MERVRWKHRLYKLLIISILILSGIMCSVISYNWASMECGIRHLGYSAPAYVALYAGIPYFVALWCCIIFAILIGKNKKQKFAGNLGNHQLRNHEKKTH